MYSSGIGVNTHANVYVVIAFFADTISSLAVSDAANAMATHSNRVASGNIQSHSLFAYCIVDIIVN